MGKLFVLVLTTVAVLWRVSSTLAMIDTKRLCEDTEITLGKGAKSAVLVSLTSSGEEHCILKIKAPDTHIVSMTVVEVPSPIYLHFRKRYYKDESCNLTVFQTDSTGSHVWQDDLCDPDTLKEVDLLNPELTLVFNPPQLLANTFKRKLLFTSVGRGNICRRNDQHTCMSIGHQPLFCISEDLICDGFNNCPKGATKSDEDAVLCNHSKHSNHINNMFKDGLRPDTILNTLRTKTSKPGHTSLNEILAIATKLDENLTPSTTQKVEEDKPPSALESLSITLSHYGPWGYILLGMLICGGVLMFLGVVECLKKPKSQPESIQNAPTTVLIINSQDEASPPRYDDLDPPSYSTLFPNGKFEDPPQSTNVVQNDQEVNEAPDSTNAVDASEPISTNLVDTQNSADETDGHRAEDA